jgi:hypothetical protein
MTLIYEESMTTPELAIEIEGWLSPASDAFVF